MTWMTENLNPFIIVVTCLLLCANREPLSALRVKIKSYNHLWNINILKGIKMTKMKSQSTLISILLIFYSVLMDEIEHNAKAGCFYRKTTA